MEKILEELFELWQDDRDRVIGEYCCSTNEVEEEKKEFEEMKEKVYKSLLGKQAPKTRW